VGALDIESVQVRPEPRDRNRRARLTVAVRVRNGMTGSRGGLRGRVLGPGLGRGEPLRFSSRPVPARSGRTYRGGLTLTRPRLWWPAHPRLYRLRLEAGPAGRPDQAYSTHFAVRSLVKTREGGFS
jgi:beta-galactosidase/beta-glucuronidase